MTAGRILPVLLIGVAIGLLTMAFISRDGQERPATMAEIGEAATISANVKMLRALETALRSGQYVVPDKPTGVAMLQMIDGQLKSWDAQYQDFQQRAVRAHYLNVRDYNWTLDMDTGKFKRIVPTPTAIAASPPAQVATVAPTSSHQGGKK